eukprot:712821-Rhodomonas_salina.2
MGPLAWGEESLKAYNAARRERIRRTKAGELTRRKYDSEGFPIGTHKPAPTARRKQTRGRRPRSESQGVDARCDDWSGVGLSWLLIAACGIIPRAVAPALAEDSI